MSKKRLNDLIKDINKENAPPDGWKPEDKLTNEEVAASVDLDVSDFSDDGSDLDELRDIMEGY